MTLICPECGAPVQENLLHCPECGCPMKYIKTYQTAAKSQYTAHSDPECLLSGAKQEDPDAMYWLGWCLYYGDNRFEENEDRAREVLQKAARHGHRQAMADLRIWFGESAVPRKPLQDLFARFDHLIILSLGTSGLNAGTDQIIELAAHKVALRDGKLQIIGEMDDLVLLPWKQRLPVKITELTGITEETLLQNGKTSEQVCRNFQDLLADDHTLFVAFNAQFDLCFLYYFLQRNNAAHILRPLHALDVLTVYRDRRPYPHKLTDAIQAYHLERDDTKPHGALDNVRAILSVLQAMDAERQDLSKYIDLFGYLPQYGINGKRILGIVYCEQPYNRSHPLYETQLQQEEN